MPNNQTTIVFYADEPNYELARRVVKKIEGIDPLPFNKEELGSFFISDFNDWQNPDLNSAMSKQARKELESQMPCPNVSANEAADLLNHECYYVLHLKPHREDGNKIDLFSLNDAFLFWQYFEKRFSDNNATITDSRVTVLINLSDGHNKEDYTRISKYFRLAALYYGMTFYDSIFTYGDPAGEKGKPSDIRCLAQPWTDSTIGLFPLVPIDQQTFEVLDRTWGHSDPTAPNVETDTDFSNLTEKVSDQAKQCLISAADQLKAHKAEQKAQTKPLFTQHRKRNPEHIANAILILVKDFASSKRNFVNLVPQLPDLQEASLFKLLFLLFYLIKLPQVDDLITLMESAEIPADALRQLLENIKNHSSVQVGILSMRFHNKNKPLPKQRLERDYNLLVDDLEEDEFVEINIRDASDKGIPDTFIDQAQKFIDIANPDWHKLETYLHTSRELERCWKSYYRKQESAALHRGISVFLSSIRAADGLFYANSFCSAKENLNPEIQRFVSKEPTNPKEEEGGGGETAILGTSYGIIYPIKIPSSEYFQLIDVKQNRRIDHDDYSFVKISAKDMPLDENYKNGQILGQDTKNEFGATAFRELQKQIADGLPESYPKQKTIVDIRFDYDDEEASVKNDALIKHIGRLYQNKDIIPNAEKTALAIGCRTVSDVYSAIQTLYQTWEAFADDKQLQNVETFIYDYTSGLNQTLWYGKSINDVLAVDGSRTVQFGGESLLQVVIRNPGSHDRTQSERFIPPTLTQFPLLINKAGKLNLATDEVTRNHNQYHSTLFEVSLSSILQRDIADPNRQGYRLSDVHFRIGSKIHISDFYQAFPLFHNGYYVNGFSNLLTERIVNDYENLKESDEATPKKVDPKKELIILIGYGGYSELVTERTRQYIEKAIKDVDIDYLIFEPTRVGLDPSKGEGWLFRRLRRLKQDYEKGDFKSKSEFSKFSRILIYQIVPISSTCTTVSKTGDAILRVLKNAKVKNAIIRKSFIPVWVRDNGPSTLLSEQEKIFFKGLDLGKQQLTTTQPLPIKENNPSEVYIVDYLIPVTTKWYKATECKLCFPENQACEEKPLIETDKSSVVPFAQFGLRLKDRETKTDGTGDSDNDATPDLSKFLFPGQKENDERLSKSLFPKTNNKSFSSFVYYGHTERSVNHYQYFLNTERILANLIASNDNHFREWTDALKQEIDKTRMAHNGDEMNRPDIYDVIVSPLHSTNSGFLDYIATKVFENNALIINAEFEKDYKDNFEAKYNYLRKQINNQRILRNQTSAPLHQKLIINVYYVNDTLNHSGDFYRTKDLIISLFKPESDMQNSNVRVDIFHGIILLINRLSGSSKLAFIDYKNDSGKPRLFSFFNLAISNMRNYEDACTLCSWHKTTKSLESYSSTNIVARHWRKKSVENKVKRASAINWNDSVYLKSNYQKIEKELDEKKRKKKKAKLLVKIKGIRKSYYRTMIAHRSKVLNEFNETEESLNEILELISEAAAKPGKNGPRSLLLSKTGFVEDYREERVLLLISFIRVLSRPFPSFRIATKNAVFKMIVELLDGLIEQSTPAQNDTTDDEQKEGDKKNWRPKEIIDEYIDFFKELKSRKKHRERITPARIIYILMGRLTSMGSTFLLQEGVFQKLDKFLDAKNFEKNKSEDGDPDVEQPDIKSEYSFERFSDMFLINVKRTLEIMGDDSKCLLLEMKLADCIRKNKSYFSYKLDNQGEPICIDLPIYIENTRILREGIAELDAIRCRDGKGTDGKDTNPPQDTDKIADWLKQVEELDYFPYLPSGEKKESALYFLDNFTEFLKAGFVDKNYLHKTVSSMVGLKALLGKKSKTKPLKFENPERKSLPSLDPKLFYTMVCDFSCRITQADRVDLYVLRNGKSNNGIGRRAQYAWFAGSQLEEHKDGKVDETDDCHNNTALTPVADRFLAALRDHTCDSESKWEYDSYCINPLKKEAEAAGSEPANAIYLKFPIGYKLEDHEHEDKDSEDEDECLKDKNKSNNEIVIMRLTFDGPTDDNEFKIDDVPIRFAAAIRSILLYRQALIDRLEADCANDYFETVRMNRILSDLNTHTHTDSDFLSAVWNTLSKWGNENDNGWLPRPNLFLQLLINHYIGDIRIAGLLPETDSQSHGKHPLALSKYSRGRILADDTAKFIEMLSTIDSNKQFTLLDRNSSPVEDWSDFINRVEQDNKVMLYVRNNSQEEHFPWRTYVVIILQVLLDSIEAHKKWSDDQTEILVNIEKCADVNNGNIFNLSIETVLEKNSFNELEESLIDIENRENGVSLIAVYNAIKRLTGDEFPIGMFIHRKKLKKPDDSYSCKFNLPILEGLPINESEVANHE